MAIWLYIEILLQFLLCASVLIVEVFDDDAMLQKSDACRDVRRMLQVMTRNKYGSTLRLVIFHEQLLQMVLTAGVKEVERFVEDDELRACEQCSHDAHLLLVAGREVAYILFCPNTSPFINISYWAISL